MKSTCGPPQSVKVEVSLSHIFDVWHRKLVGNSQEYDIHNAVVILTFILFPSSLSLSLSLTHTHTHFALIPEMKKKKKIYVPILKVVVMNI